MIKLLAPLIKEQKSINSQLSPLSKAMNDLKGTLIQMQRVCESSVPTNSTIDINCDDNGFKIPCSAIVDFKKFDGKLKSDKEYRNKIVRVLYDLFFF